MPATRIGNDDDAMLEGGVILSRNDDGAYLLPARLRTANAMQRRVIQQITGAVRLNVAALAQLDEYVPAARRAGLSWDSIGWLVGMSGRGAQKRWGDDG